MACLPARLPQSFCHRVVGKDQHLKPADMLAPGFETARLEAVLLARTEEDVLTHALSQPTHRSPGQIQSITQRRFE